MSEINLDYDRLSRQGFPEVVYGRGKTRAQTIEALKGLVSAHGHAFATGVAEDLELGGDYDAQARTYRIGSCPGRSCLVGVVTAGTSDQAVAEEAAQSLLYFGYEVLRVSDVGVAGLHRLLSRLDDIRRCRVIIVVAGMEGALASVLGGLVSQPVIAVPTSVGYGANFGGLAALLSMLNSCAAGISVMNIDNGFGAAMAARRILM